jgi:hypothetical protein
MRTVRSYSAGSGGDDFRRGYGRSAIGREHDESQLERRRQQQLRNTQRLQQRIIKHAELRQLW